MPSPSVDWVVRLYEVLRAAHPEGVIWLEREYLIRQMMPLIPAGRALRFVERERKNHPGRTVAAAPETRTRPRSEEFLIAAGRRGIAAHSLVDNKRKLETKTDDAGKIWIRLRQPKEADQ